MSQVNVKSHHLSLIAEEEEERPNSPQSTTGKVLLHCSFERYNAEAIANCILTKEIFFVSFFLGRTEVTFADTAGSDEAAELATLNSVHS